MANRTLASSVAPSFQAKKRNIFQQITRGELFWPLRLGLLIWAILSVLYWIPASIVVVSRGNHVYIKPSCHVVDDMTSTSPPGSSTAWPPTVDTIERMVWTSTSQLGAPLHSSDVSAAVYGSAAPVAVTLPLLEESISQPAQSSCQNCTCKVDRSCNPLSWSTWQGAISTYSVMTVVFGLSANWSHNLKKGSFFSFPTARCLGPLLAIFTHVGIYVQWILMCQKGKGPYDFSLWSALVMSQGVTGYGFYEAVAQWRESHKQDLTGRDIRLILCVYLPSIAIGVVLAWLTGAIGAGVWSAILSLMVFVFKTTYDILNKDLKAAEADKESTAAVQRPGTVSTGRRVVKRDARARAVAQAQVRKALLGVPNLGNSCYVNSAVVSLAHAAPLVRYAFSGEYERRVSLAKIHGIPGHLATSFRELLKQLWRCGQGQVQPEAFVALVERMWFEGPNQQQDSGELVSRLLDGLHEDLRLGTVKSFIHELFQVRLLSVRRCPACNERRTDDEVENILFIPLPPQTLLITIIFMDGSHMPETHAVNIPRTGPVALLYDKVASLTGVNEAQTESLLLLASVESGRVDQLFEDPAECIDASWEGLNLVAYRYASVEQGRIRSNTLIKCMHRRQLLLDITTGAKDTQHPALPLVICLPQSVVRELSWEPEMQAFLQIPGEYTLRRPNVLDEMLHAALSPFERTLPPSNPLERSAHAGLFRRKDWEVKAMGEMGETRLKELPSFDQKTVAVAVVWTLPGEIYYDLRPLETPAMSNSASAFLLHRQAPVGAPPTLEACIEEFLAQEVLVVPSVCDSCNRKVQKEKHFELHTLPELLSLSLKRFVYRSADSAYKVSAYVEFPLHNLDLSPMVTRKQEVAPVYELYAVSCHHGHSCAGGHYTTYGRMDDGSWFYYDDDVVQPASEEEVLTSQAYILFYRRKSEAKRDPGGLLKLAKEVAKDAARVKTAEKLRKEAQAKSPLREPVPDIKSLQKIL